MSVGGSDYYSKHVILWQVYMFLSAYESIQACQMMDELFGIHGKAFGSSNS